MAKFVPAKLYLTLVFAAFVALVITVAPLQTHNAHAAARTSTVTTHPSNAMSCNYKTYSLSSTLELVDYSNGTVLDYQASNMNGQYTVKIAHNGYYIGEYYLTTYDDYNRVRIYVGYYGGEYVDACLD